MTQKFHFWLYHKRIEHRNLNRFLHIHSSKESACNAGDPGLIPRLGRSSGEEIGYPLQYPWASLVVQTVKNLPVIGRPGFDPWVGKIPWRRERLPTPVFWPGEFHGLCSPWCLKESDRLSDFHFHFSLSIGDLPNPGMEPRSPTFQVDSLPAEPPGKPQSTGNSR